MKTLKNLSAALLISVAAVAGAQDIEFVVPDQLGRLNHDFERVITPALESQGFRVRTVMAGNCGRGYARFQETQSPTVTLAYNGYVSTDECRLPLRDQDLVATVAQGPVVVCARPDVTDSVARIARRETVTIGVGGGDWPRPVILDLNPGFRIVPYSSSGDLARGFMAGDTQYIITNMLRAQTLVRSGHARCLATTSNAVTAGIPPARTVWPHWQWAGDLQQAWALLARNLTDQDRVRLSEAMARVLTSDPWLELVSRAEFQTTSMTAQEFVKSSRVWAQR